MPKIAAPIPSLNDPYYSEEWRFPIQYFGDEEDCHWTHGEYVPKAAADCRQILDELSEEALERVLEAYREVLRTPARHAHLMIAGRNPDSGPRPFCYISSAELRRSGIHPMKKTVTCTKCNRSFTLEGTQSNKMMVMQSVTCPFCKEPNEVEWPLEAGWTKNPPDK